MIVITLVENTAESDAFDCEHGLSLYIEANNHNILFDTGQSELFIKNAKKMNIDLNQVDTVIISHGHYDHGGGLARFLDLNKKAKIYINRQAFGCFYSKRGDGEYHDIGLDKNLVNHPNILFADDYFKIDDGLTLFSSMKSHQFFPINNQHLYKKQNNGYIHDDFSHEQSLLIKEKDNRVLIAGCAHTGIVNIVDEIKRNTRQFPTHVIGGFHLYNRSTDTSELPSVIDGIGSYLDQTNAKYYTCHCTGMKAYLDLKRILQKKIEYIVTGKQFTII